MDTIINTDMSIKPARDHALDRFRGLAIVLMAIVNGLDIANGLPSILHHAEDKGFTIADIVAPMFIFAIALNFYPSFMKRLQRNARDAYVDTARRYLAILGIGCILSAIESFVELNTWGALQSIGIAGLITLLVIRLKPWQRLSVGFGVLIGYQVIIELLDSFMYANVLGVAHGGLFGSIAWGAMLIICTVLADFYREKKYKNFAIVLGISAAVFLIAVFAFDIIISKNRVSLPYVLLSILICAAVYLAIRFITEKWFNKPDFLCSWGKNPITLYILHLLVLAIMRIITDFNDALWLCLLEEAILLTALSLLAVLMDKKKVYISI